MGYFRPDRLSPDPDATQARRDARLVLLVANEALRGRGGSCDPEALHAITLDPRMTPRLQRRAAMALLRLHGADRRGVRWERGRG
mgnify:CR=1 FL=1